MPRHYFHVHDGNNRDRDHVGTELAYIHEARREAVNVARELCDLWDDLPPGALNNMAIGVTDETGHTVLMIPFSVVLR
jgi:hypothetical protein